MKLTDVAKEIIINPRKFTDYALNLNSPYGKHKAILFQKLLGITIQNYTYLVSQLETKILQAEITFHSEDAFGRRYNADILIEGSEGQQAIVRIGWLVPAETAEAHLVTLYVKRR
ncbi:MAG: hypothetical protein U0401_22575 [Anaerolineae bacterium]